jgi:hypothetical protein
VLVDDGEGDQPKIENQGLSHKVGKPFFVCEYHEISIMRNPSSQTILGARASARLILTIPVFA